MPPTAAVYPQATNLQALGGIEKLKKGCYTGQEMVARAKSVVPTNALWLLKGSASRLPEAGEDLELKMGENWRRTGTVLATVKLEDGQVWCRLSRITIWNRTASSA